MAPNQWLCIASTVLSVCLGHVIHRRQAPEIPDESLLPHEVVTRSLPTLPNGDINSRYMPIVGNGHLSATIYSNEMYINGLYQGSGSSSHRAMIPTILAPRVQFKDPELEDSTERTYRFNVQTGVFTEEIENDQAYIEYRTYAHQKYTRLLVTDIFATRKVSSGDVEIEHEYPTNLNGSSDYSFNRPVDHKGAQHIRAWTLNAEVGENTQDFNMIQYRRIYEVTLTDEEPVSRVTMIMSVDKAEQVSKDEFDRGADIVNDPDRGGAGLLQEHIDAMADLWSRGGVEITGELDLAKVTSLSQYYLLTSLPAQDPSAGNVDPSYSSARTGLAKGGLAQDYQGHIFWDSEFYIFPAVLAFYPDQARSIIDYRTAKFSQAQANAESYGQQGARYPWESAYSGNDVTPAGCPTCKDQQIFVSAAVSWAIGQYYSATGGSAIDSDACDMTREIARFYDSVITFSSDKNQFEINNVMGPDDFHPNVNNNAFINTIARLTTEYARYFACECGRDPESEIPDEWLGRVRNLYVPFDAQNFRNYQYEGYELETNRTIKQADAILLTYPLGATDSAVISRNDLEYYSEVMLENAPALTDSFASIGWNQVGDSERAGESFARSVANYNVRPFRIWTEYNEETFDADSSSANFLPGAGGFLQSLIYGYGGAQYNPGSLEFRRPLPPPGVDELKLRGIKYQGYSFDITINGEGETSVLVNSVGPRPLVLSSSAEGVDGVTALSAGLEIQIEGKEGFSIFTTEPSQCQLDLL